MKNMRVLKSWSKHNLPNDLWSEILSYLPAKNLLRYRAVSKSWREMIDDSEFCRLHLTRFKNNLDETQLLVVEGNSKRKEFCLRSTETFRVKSRLGSLESPTMSFTGANNPTFELVKYWGVISSTDGVIMLRNERWYGPTLDVDLVLWNPSIRKARTVPPSPQIPKGSFSVDWGLGFDPSIMDYKHIRFVKRREDNISILHCVEIYTLGSNTWRTIPFDEAKGRYNYNWRYLYNTKNSVFLNGTMYVMGWKSDPYVLDLVSFDLNTEVFVSTTLPKEWEDWDPWGMPKANKTLTLVDGGNSLAIFVYRETEGHLWVLQGSKTWAKRYTFKQGPFLKYYCTSFLYLQKNGGLFLRWGGSYAVKRYNVETHDEKMVKKNNHSNIYSVWDYKESLMLLN